MRLKSMSIGRLATLRDQVEAALKSRVAQARHDLEGRLATLSQFGKVGGRGTSFGKQGRSVAPKYRNPENPAETWAGRGLKPRWLTAAMKGGKSLEDFAIAPGGTASKANSRKKAGGATAKAKGAKADVCPICDFQTTPPHDRRAHRHQKKKAPLSAE